MRHIRLGINIDHVATLRNARGGTYPDPLLAAMLATEAGADGITAHLREDRRHIRDEDMRQLKAALSLPLNFEMAATPEMLAIALAIKPHAVCLVPERREEVTTEGGLSVSGHEAALTPIVSALAAAGIRVSLFIDPDHRQLDAAVQVGAPVVELHTGAYAEEFPHGRINGLARLREAARYSRSLGLECHAGHGLTVDNVGPVAAIPEIVELNIGHFIIGNAIFIGLPAAIARMRAAIDAGTTR